MTTLEMINQKYLELKEYRKHYSICRLSVEELREKYINEEDPMSKKIIDHYLQKHLEYTEFLMRNLHLLDNL